MLLALFGSQNHFSWPLIVYMPNFRFLLTTEGCWIQKSFNPAAAGLWTTYFSSPIFDIFKIQAYLLPELSSLDPFCGP